MSTHNRTPIMGPSVATAEQMLRFARRVNPNFPEELPRLYLQIGEKYNIRGDIAFAQMIKETGYHRFTGDVNPNQHNYAGIGAVGGGARGASFATPEEGVRAHIQHLFAYATIKALPAGEKLVDPRFHLVTRGIAPYWEDLNGRWAVPGHNYGQEIVAIYRDILRTEAPNPSPNPTPNPSPTPVPNPTPTPPLDNLNEVPVWARPTVKKLVDLGILNDPSGDVTFYRLLVVLDRLGLINRREE